MKRILTAVAAALAAAVVTSAVPAYASPAPFKDPNAIGRLTLCNTLGHPMTSGSTHTLPFVWTAVGSSPAPADYQKLGTGALFAYQPIRGVNPTGWYGEYLTASGRFTNAQRPAARATAVDPSLDQYLQHYPTRWNGLVQLRLFLGAPGKGAYTQRYNAAVIRVSGHKWTLVEGGTDGCGKGDATSVEAGMGPRVTALGTPAPNATAITVPPDYAARFSAAAKSMGFAAAPVVTATKATPVHAGGTQSSPAGTANATGTATDSSSESTALAGAGSSDPTASTRLAAKDSSSSGISAGLITLIVVAVLLMAGAGGLILRRRKAGAATAGGSHL